MGRSWRSPSRLPPSSSSLGRNLSCKHRVILIQLLGSFLAEAPHGVAWERGFLWASQGRKQSAASCAHNGAVPGLSKRCPAYLFHNRLYTQCVHTPRTWSWSHRTEKTSERASPF